MEKYVNLKVADGTEMEAYTAIPEDAVGKSSPGLILVQEAFGVNHHIRDMADRFAAQGFVVIAPEMYHRHILKLVMPNLIRLGPTVWQ
jgi:carboxymethylenebutenolidase